MSIYEELVLLSVDHIGERDSYMADVISSKGVSIPLEDESELKSFAGDVYDAVHRDFKTISDMSGLKYMEIASWCCIPYSTMRKWSSGVYECPLYTRLMIQECLGVFSVPNKFRANVEKDIRKEDT